MYTHAIHIPQFPYYTRKNRADKRLHCRTLQFEALEERDFLSVNAPILENGGIPDTSPWTNPAELHAPAETSSFVGNVEFPEAFTTGNTGFSTISPVETAAEAARLDTVFAGPVPLRPVTVEAVSSGQDAIFDAGNSATADFSAANPVSTDFATVDSTVMDSAVVDFVLADSAVENTGGKTADEDGVVELLAELKEQTPGLDPTVVSKALAAWEPAMAASDLDLTGSVTDAKNGSSAPTEVPESQGRKTTSAPLTAGTSTTGTPATGIPTGTPTSKLEVLETSTAGLTTGIPVSKLEVLETTMDTMDLEGDPNLNAELKPLTTASSSWLRRQWPYYDPFLDQNTFQYGAGIPTRFRIPGIPSGDTGGEAGFNGGGALALEIPGFSGYGNAYYLDIFDASLPRTIWLYAMYFRNQARITPGPVYLARPTIDHAWENCAFDGYHIGGSVYFSLIVDDEGHSVNAEIKRRLENEDRREKYEQFLKKEQEEFLNRTLKEQQKADEENEQNEETKQNDTQPVNPKEQAPPEKTDVNTQETDASKQKTATGKQETDTGKRETTPNESTDLPQRN